MKFIMPPYYDFLELSYNKTNIGCNTPINFDFVISIIKDDKKFYFSDDYIETLVFCIDIFTVNNKYIWYYESKEERDGEYNNLISILLQHQKTCFSSNK